MSGYLHTPLLGYMHMPIMSGYMHTPIVFVTECDLVELETKNCNKKNVDG